MRPKLAEERKFRVGSSEIIHQLIELKIKAGELEMYRSLHAIDAAINAAGWETAARLHSWDGDTKLARIAERKSSHA